MQGLVERLRESGLLTKDQIKRAADRQWKQGGSLLQHLVELGYLKEEDVLDFFSKVLGLHVVRLKEIDIDPDAIYYIPYRIAARYFLIPIKRTKKSLIVAMSNPLNKRALKEISFVTDLEIIPLAAKLSEIKSAILSYYGKLDPPRYFDVFFVRPDPTKNLEDLDTQAEENAILLDKIEEFLRSSGGGLLVYGGEGSGKTFLIHAVANKVLLNSPDAGVLITSGTLLRDLFQEIEESGLYPQLREFFNDHRFLMVDDLEGIRDTSRFADFIDWYLTEGGHILATAVRDLKSAGLHRRVLRRLEKFEHHYLPEISEEEEIETVLAETSPLDQRVDTAHNAPENQQSQETAAAIEPGLPEDAAFDDKFKEYLESIRSGKAGYERILEFLKFLKQRPKSTLLLRLKTLKREALKRGGSLKVFVNPTMSPPEWFIEGLEELTRKVVQILEEGDEIQLRIQEAPGHYQIQYRAKPLLLMLDASTIQEIFEGKTVEIEKEQKDSQSVLTVTVNKE